MKRGDKAMTILFLILLLLLSTLYFVRYFNSQENLTAEVLSNGELIRKINLKKDSAEKFVITYKNGENIICVEEGKIAVISATCPDKDCVRRGWLKKRGDSAVCLPNRLSIRIIGAAEVDAVTF